MGAAKTNNVGWLIGSNRLYPFPAGSELADKTLFPGSRKPRTGQESLAA